MEQIKRFFECLVPVTACNLKCSYCYIIQRNHRTMKVPKLTYTVESLGNALSKERLGGACYFSLCGAGETLLADQIVDICRELLKQGHYVNVTTNGTLSKVFIKFSEFPIEYRERLDFSFSFHYLELIRIRKLDEFFANIDLVHKLGCSYIVQVNLCDEYEPYLDEIKNVCKLRTGAYPQLAATRKEINIYDKIEFLTEHTVDDYKKMGESFSSKLFDFTLKNFNIKRKEFCYAGAWSGVIDLERGSLRKCYSDASKGQDIFDFSRPLDFDPIGCCGSPFCMNSSHFLSLGMIPELFEDITYFSLRNRENANWFNNTMREALSTKLNNSNEELAYNKRFRIYLLSKLKIVKSNAIYKTKRVLKKCYRNNY